MSGRKYVRHAVCEVDNMSGRKYVKHAVFQVRNVLIRSL